MARVATSVCAPFPSVEFHPEEENGIFIIRQSKHLTSGVRSRDLGTSPPRLPDAGAAPASSRATEVSAIVHIKPAPPSSGRLWGPLGTCVSTPPRLAPFPGSGLLPPGQAIAGSTSPLLEALTVAHGKVPTGSCAHVAFQAANGLLPLSRPQSLTFTKEWAEGRGGWAHRQASWARVLPAQVLGARGRTTVLPRRLPLSALLSLVKTLLGGHSHTPVPSARSKAGGNTLASKDPRLLRLGRASALGSSGSGCRVTLGYPVGRRQPRTPCPQRGLRRYLHHDARRDVLQHHTVAGLVGCLAPWAVSFHKLLLELVLIQGRQRGPVFPACCRDCSDRRPRGQPRQLLPKPEPTGHGAYSGQWCRKMKQA